MRQKLKSALIQNCPPELAACEVCGRPECSEAKWRSCENRLAAQQCLRTGDRSALLALRRKQSGCAREPVAARHT